MAILPKESSIQLLISSYAQKIQDKVAPVVNSLHSGAKTALVTSKSVVDRYPPIKALVVSFAALSSLPLLIFLAVIFFSTMTLLGFFSTGFMLLNGLVLAVSSSILLFWLSVGSVGAVIAAFWFSVGYFGYQTMKKMNSIKK